MTTRVQSVIVVSQPLAKWVEDRLGVPPHRIRHVSNFVCEDRNNEIAGDLPGSSGSRIVCVANLRPEKDHLTLLRAMRSVIQEASQAHLLLVGSYTAHTDYSDLVRQEISELGLSDYASLLGPRRDVTAVLRACDIGVLSSASEGLPLALLEYGQAGLPVVATMVGQCEEVLDSGRAGILVPPSSPEQLAKALLSLLRCQQRRKELANAFCRRIRDTYSAGPIIEKICQVYEAVLQGTEPTDRPSDRHENTALFEVAQCKDLEIAEQTSKAIAHASTLSVSDGGEN